VFGVVKILVLLGSTVAAFNVDRIRGFRAELAERSSEKTSETLGSLVASECLSPRPPNDKLPARGPAVCAFQGMADESKTHRHLQQGVS
jgi:hypothetical protein